MPSAVVSSLDRVGQYDKEPEGPRQRIDAVVEVQNFEIRDGRRISVLGLPKAAVTFLCCAAAWLIARTSSSNACPSMYSRA